MGRLADVRAALRDDTVFRSGAGVAAKTHTRRRKVLMRSLGAEALTEIEGRVPGQAVELVERLCARRWFDAAVDFSAHLPLSIVADLVGVRPDGQRVLRWAAATFGSLGPLNRRGVGSPQRLRNTTPQGIAALPARFVPA